MANALNVHGDHVEITLSGELTFSSYKEFQEVMKSATDAGKNACIIDLSALESIDSAGIDHTDSSSSFSSSSMLLVAAESGSAEAAGGFHVKFSSLVRSFSNSSS